MKNAHITQHTVIFCDCQRTSSLKSVLFDTQRGHKQPVAARHSDVLTQSHHKYHEDSRGLAHNRELAAKWLYCAQADLSSSRPWLLSACVLSLQGLEG
jgi:hypothetical protein